jgi:hypothetical protein
MTIQEIFEKWATYDYTNYDGSDVKTMSEPEFQLAVDELMKAQREACVRAYENQPEDSYVLDCQAILNAKVSNESK